MTMQLSENVKKRKILKHSQLRSPIFILEFGLISCDFKVIDNCKSKKKT